MAKTYSVTHQGYCGMSIPLGSDFTWKEARERVKRRIAWFKATIKGPVTWLSPKQVELGEPDGCMMVPDACGTLEITEGKNRIL